MVDTSDTRPSTSITTPVEKKSPIREFLSIQKNILSMILCWSPMSLMEPWEPMEFLERCLDLDPLRSPGLWIRWTVIDLLIYVLYQSPEASSPCSRNQQPFRRSCLVYTGGDAAAILVGPCEGAVLWVLFGYQVFSSQSQSWPYQDMGAPRPASSSISLHQILPSGCPVTIFLMKFPFHVSSGRGSKDKIMKYCSQITFAFWTCHQQRHFLWYQGWCQV